MTFPIEPGKRVALLLPNLKGGGVQRVLGNLGLGLKDLDLEVDLISCDHSGPLRQQLENSLNIVHCKNRYTIAAFLVSYLRKRQPVALISGITRMNVAAVSAKYLSRAPTKFIVTKHLPPSQLLRGKSAMHSLFVRQAIRRVYPKADAIVAVSSGVAQELRELLGQQTNIHMIHNPVISPKLHLFANQPVSHPWFADNAPPVLLGVGRLTAQKDFHTLIKAFDIIKDQCPARLIILGEGEQRPLLEQLIRDRHLQDRISLPGFVQNPFSYMSKSALFILSSAWEGLPTVLIEALACGTRVVATDCHSGPREILQDGRLGELCEVGNPQALSEAMLRSLATPKTSALNSLHAYTIKGASRNYLHLLKALYD